MTLQLMQLISLLSSRWLSCLFVEQVVLAVEKDEVDHPTDILDVMQDYFIVFGTRSPMH